MVIIIRTNEAELSHNAIQLVCALFNSGFYPPTGEIVMVAISEVFELRAKTQGSAQFSDSLPFRVRVIIISNSHLRHALKNS